MFIVFSWKHALDAPCSEEVELNNVPSDQRNEKSQLAELYTVLLSQISQLHGYPDTESYLRDDLVPNQLPIEHQCNWAHNEEQLWMLDGNANELHPVVPQLHLLLH